jgi:hypothetical protein
MGDKEFWDIVETGCQPPASPDDWWRTLHDLLIQLPPREIVHFDWLFDAKTTAAYTVDLWGAAYLINGGASDDGFYYFRCWLVGMGKKVYEAALLNPDSLADVVDPAQDYEAEIYSVGHNAWCEVSGQPDTEPMDTSWLGQRPRFELVGEDWDFNDDEEVRRRFPRLAELYLGDTTETWPR